MDTATGLAAHVFQGAGRMGVPLVVTAVALMVAAFIAVIAMAGILAPAPETIVAAPFRWDC
ncbi:MAG: hypothetical protein U9O18_02610 [Chloroflexota bacterium]|nr:hypothetical protein [Chloroflexota bacterium]